MTQEDIIRLGREDIIRMAKEAGIGWGLGVGGMEDFLERFAQLVAAAERERLASFVDEYTHGARPDISAAIRARGQQ